MSLLLILIMACEEAASPIPIDAQIGTGEWEWSELEEGGDIPVIQGPQGGFHLLGSVRVSGIETGDADTLSATNNPTTSFFVWVDGTNLTPGASYTQGLDSSSNLDDSYTHEMLGRFAILDIESDDELDGIELLFEVVVEDVNGTVVGDYLNLVAYPHPYNL